MPTHSIVDDILCAISDLSVHPPASADPSITHQPRAPATQSNNPLLKLSPDAAKDAKSLFVTLHVMFPHEFLPALDLLDRGLVNKLVPVAPSLTATSNDAQSTATRTSSTSDDTSIRSTGAPTSAPTDFDIPYTTPPSDLYYIQSASAVSSNPRVSHTQPGVRHPSSDNASTKDTDRHRNRNRATQTYYEVRLDAWNCSCAAFAFSVLKSLGLDEREGGGGEGGEVFRDIGEESRGVKGLKSEAEGPGGDVLASFPIIKGAERGHGIAAGDRRAANVQKDVEEPRRRTSSGRGHESSDIPNTSSKNSTNLSHPDQASENTDPSNQVIHNTINDADKASTANPSTPPTAPNHPHCRFGGTLTHHLTHPSIASTSLPIPRPVPTCKHMLAAILAKAAPNIFVEGQHVKILEAGKEELGGWGGGWGDG